MGEELKLSDSVRQQASDGEVWQIRAINDQGRWRSWVAGAVGGEE